MSDAFFVPAAGRLEPTPSARSPWSEQMLHGRLLAGLCVRAVQAVAADPALRIARVTADLFRYPPMEPVLADAQVVRDGRRIRVADAWVRTAAGVDLARASVVLLRTAEQPAQRPWAPPEWDLPVPTGLEEGAAPPFPLEVRPAPGSGFGAPGQRRLWLRERQPLVAGEPLTPAQRAVLAADLANPIANAAVGGLDFINADISVYLVREAAGEWIGLESMEHRSADGIAAGQVRLYDERGAIGHSSVAALVNPRMVPTAE